MLHQSIRRLSPHTFHNPSHLSVPRFESVRPPPRAFRPVFAAIHTIRRQPASSDYPHIALPIPHPKPAPDNVRIRQPIRRRLAQPSPHSSAFRAIASRVLDIPRWPHAQSDVSDHRNRPLPRTRLPQSAPSAIAVDYPSEHLRPTPPPSRSQRTIPANTPRTIHTRDDRKQTTSRTYRAHLSPTAITNPPKRPRTPSLD